MLESCASAQRRMGSLLWHISQNCTIQKFGFSAADPVINYLNFILEREYWGITEVNGQKTSHAGVTLDFADLQVPGLKGIIHIQFTEPSLDPFNFDDILGWETATS